MPASRTKQKKNNVTDGDFELKNRVVGAAVLLLFGALFLPWLLGAPDATNTLNLNTDASNASEKPALTSLPSTALLPANVLEVDLQSAIAGEQSLADERVYISKITPLDGQPKNADPKEPAQTALDTSTPNIINSPDPIVDSPPNNQAGSSAAEPAEAAEVSTANDKSRNNDAVTTVKVGWIVQVGVFIEKAGSERVVQDLHNKGFNPSTSIVDTNRGKDTGTRIWLGPFEQRVEAAKAKAKLKNETGEAGFIRAYP